jgi:hypothetical protein
MFDLGLHSGSETLFLDAYSHNKRP